MAFYKYTKYEVPGPTGYSISFKNVSDNNETSGDTELIRAVELGEINGERYVFVPDEIVASFPEQPKSIKWTGVEMTKELREELKKVSRQCELISEEMIKKIRARYSDEDENYFARIGVGVALGAYEFQEGEQEELLAFGKFVEEVREWGRSERAKFGL